MRKFTPLFFALVLSLAGKAVNYTAVINGNWNVNATWGGSGHPGVNDNATIPAGITVTVPNSVTASCLDLTINATGKLQLNWAIQVYGNVVNNGTITGGNTVYLYGTSKTVSGSGTFNITGTGGMYVGGTRTFNSGCVISVANNFTLQGGAVLTNNGTLTLNYPLIGGSALSRLNNGPTGTLIAKNTVLATGVLNASAAGNTVIYAQTSGTQTIKAPLTTYANLTIQGGGTKKLAAATVCTGNFLWTASAFSMNSKDFSVGGNWTNNANLTASGMATVTLNGTGSQTVFRTSTESFNNLTVSGTGTVTLATLIQVNGNYSQSSGTFDVSASNYAVTVLGSFTLSGGTYNAQAGTLSVRGNFTHSAGTFTAGTGTVVFNGTAAQTIGGASVTAFHNMTISNPTSVTLSSAKQLQSTGTMTLTAGSFDTGGFDFTLLSSASGTARIATVPSGSSLNGATYVIQRFIPGPATAYWDYLCAPVSGTTFARWDNVTSPTPFYMSGIGGNDGNSCCPIFRSVRRFNEATNAYVNITSTATAISRGTGYMIWVASTTSQLSGPLLYDSKGSVVSTDQSIAVTKGSGGGYNLIGNPMPSQILWSSVFGASSNLSNQFLILDNTLQNYATWNGGTNTGTGQLAGSGGVINSGQGFMVLATAGTTVSIPESAKTALSSAFVRSMDATNVIKVKLANNYDRSGAEDMISFMPDGNNGFDDADLPFLPSPFEKSSSLKLFSTDGHALMGASVNAYAESHEIPVAVTGPMPGMYTLSFSGISNISNYNCIYLEDKQSGKVFNLKRGDAYSFAIQDPGVEYKFVLHLENEKASANGSLACRFEVDQTGHLSDAVNMFSNENGFSIDFGFSTSTPVTIEVYNSIGELVIAPARREVTDELISIGADLPSGLYIVRVTANGELINRKLFHL